MRSEGYLEMLFPSGDGMRVYINDKPHELSEQATIAEALHHLGVASQGLAVAVNAEVVPKKDWESCVLGHEDAVMLIRATKGG